jgi:hypothetical protein
MAANGAARWLGNGSRAWPAPTVGRSHLRAARSYGERGFVGAAHGREWGRSVAREWLAGMARSYGGTTSFARGPLQR